MENADKLYKKLGENNVKLFLKEADDGKVNEYQLKEMALEMKVHGTYMENKDKMTVPNLAGLLLDDWYRKSLYGSLSGRAEFKAILTNDRVKLSHLAEEMNFVPDSELLNPHFIDIVEPPSKKDSDREAKVPLINVNGLASDMDTNGEANNFLKRENKFVLIFLIVGIVVAIGVSIGGCWSLCSCDYLKNESIIDLGKSFYDQVRNSTVNNTKSSNCQNKRIPINPNTRTFIVQKGKFVELHPCPHPQIPIPSLPAKLDKVVGIYAEVLGLLVCGGITERYNPRIEFPKLCFTHKLGADGWEEFYKLNTNRIGSFIKRNGNKIIIFRGQSSHPLHDCYQSQEVLDLDNLLDGWDEEPSKGTCYTDQRIDVPCIKKSTGV